MRKIFIGLLSLIIALSAIGMPVYAAPPTASGNTIVVEKVVENSPGDTSEFQIVLKDKNGTTIGTGTISQGKSFSFENVPAGDYTLEEAATAGYETLSNNPAFVKVRGKNNSYTITVTNRVITQEPPSTDIPVTGVSLDVHAISLEIGQIHTLVATVLPENATNKEVTWVSTNTSIATVDTNGLVTAISEGSATIKVTTEEGSFTDTCEVTVAAPIVAPPSTIHYVALGDSLATGTTSRGTTESYVYGFYDNLRTIYQDLKVTMANLSEDGDASTELLWKLQNDEIFKQEVAKANIITISIGGNNIMGAGKYSFSRIDHAIAEAGTSAFEREYDSIIDEIQQLNLNAKISQ